MSSASPILATDRLVLRAGEAADADDVLVLYSHPETVRWSGGAGTELATRADALERLARWRVRAAGGGPRGIWLVTEAAGRTDPAGRTDNAVRAGGTDSSAVPEESGPAVVGDVLLVDLPASSPDRSRPPSGDLEIGWHLLPDRWGRGYATEAARAVLAHAWTHGVDRVLAVTHPENLASQAVARRIGMRHAGRTTAYYDTECELFVIEAPAARGSA